MDARSLNTVADANRVSQTITDTEPAENAFFRLLPKGFAA